MVILKELIDKISKNDVNGVKNILTQNDINPNSCDEHGTTPLEHAAFKGNLEIVRLLLDQGADVNLGKHEYGYSALHCGALSGNSDVCLLLLEHGAKPYATNSVGRTPSQMAAFVGNHSCVTVINNFVPKSDIEYYTVPSGFETEPKLPPLVANPLHKFIMQVNLNPVRILINLNRFPMLCENIEKVKNVLELLSRKEMRKGLETNEIMAFKFHYFSCLLDEIIKCKKSLELVNNKTSNENKKPTNAIEVIIKKLLKTNKDASSEYQEILLKEIVRKFPNRESTIFQQMVCNLSRSESPGALSIITSLINGQRGFADSNVSYCATCGEENADKKCAQCKTVQYCDKDCQRYHWFIHKKYCANMSNSDNKSTDENSKEKAINLEKS